MESDYVARTREEGEIAGFLSDGTRPGFVYLRGRRRIGKSTILRRIAQQDQHFYFMGAKDERTTATLKRFAETWDLFARQSILTEIASRKFGWGRFFKEITRFAQQYPDRNIGIIFDEVQWLAKGQNGFVGLLKEAWLDWEQLRNIKVIVCGSSHKFFADHVGGEETILRGIRTRSDIWIQPFNVSEVAQHFLPTWSWEQVCCTYMMLGGIPYYLKQIDHNLGFIRGMSRALCNQKSIFFDEVNEILSLEFNRRGLGTIKKILSEVGQGGQTQAQLISATGMSETTVIDSLAKLNLYQILFEKENLAQSAGGRAKNCQFFTKDFYLNFFFQVLDQKMIELKQSSDPLAFADLFGSNNSFYIPNFSGKAFELLVQYELERNLIEPTALGRLVQLELSPFRVCFYRTPQVEYDLCLVHEKERLVRVFKCKWTTTAALVKHGIEQVAAAPQELVPGYATQRYVVTNAQVLKEHEKLARENKVTIVSCEELR